MERNNSQIPTIPAINAVEDNYFDNPPIYPSPPAPTRITVPVRPVEGGSPIGRIIGEIYYSAESRILQYISVDEFPEYYPTHVEWQRATSTRQASISLQIDRRENAPSTLPPSPVPSVSRVSSRVLCIILLCLGVLSTGMVSLMILYRKYFHQIFA